jgi:hypothetical protein
MSEQSESPVADDRVPKVQPSLEELEASVADARVRFDAAQSAHLAWGRLPMEQRTKARLDELEIKRRARMVKKLSRT